MDSKGDIMDWSNNCYENNDYRVVDETNQYYVCMCNRCGSIFRKWK